MVDQYRGSGGARNGVTATVKWFNPSKGFGFVQAGPNGPDVFVHASVMTRAGLTNLPNGATLVCDISEGDRGLQVSAIHSMDASTAEPEGFSERPRGGGFRDGPPRRSGGGDRHDRFDRDGGGEEHELTGTVKFYDANKGYGFVVPDGGERDVFVPGRVLPKTGLQRLEPNQRVRLRYREGDKGPLATWVESI
jgi:CspA family cold shock protein